MMTLQELNERFEYKLDSEQFGFSEVWLGLQEVDGKLVGDCEDYAITVKNNIEGFKKWRYHYCKLNGIGHCILVSPNGNDMIDNNVQEVIGLDRYRTIYHVSKLRPYEWYELLWKFGSAKVLKLWFKLKGK